MDYSSDHFPGYAFRSALDYPFGPAVWGISWIPLLVVALLFFFLIIALLPPGPATKAEARASEGALIAMGTFFWIMIILLLISVIVGYYRISIR